jgi:Cu/Ag efflux protein CusF
MKSLVVSTLVLTLGLLAGCSKSGDEPASHAVKGVVVEVYAEPPALLVDHEEIPGFMAAMTMRFEVEAATAAAVKPGDAITGRLRFQNHTWRLDEVKVAPPQP